MRWRGRWGRGSRPKGVWSIQLCRWVGMVFVVGGFVGIGAGWNKMARVTCVDCQLPYLLSAGAGGLGAIVLGVGLLIVAQLRTERVRLFQRLERMGASGARRSPDAREGEPHGDPTDGSTDGSKTPAGSLRRS